MQREHPQAPTLAGFATGGEAARRSSGGGGGVIEYGQLSSAISTAASAMPLGGGPDCRDGRRVT